MAFGSIYNVTWWGTSTKEGFGNIYYNLTTAGAYSARVLSDGGTVESLECVAL